MEVFTGLQESCLVAYSKSCLGQDLGVVNTWEVIGNIIFNVERLPGRHRGRSNPQRWSPRDHQCSGNRQQKWLERGVIESWQSVDSGVMENKRVENFWKERFCKSCHRCIEIKVQVLHWLAIGKLWFVLPFQGSTDFENVSLWFLDSSIFFTLGSMPWIIQNNILKLQVSVDVLTWALFSSCLSLTAYLALLYWTPQKILLWWSVGEAI